MDIWRHVRGSASGSVALDNQATRPHPNAAAKTSIKGSRPAPALEPRK